MNNSIQTLFRQSVERFPDRLAIDSGEQQLSYAELEERTNTMANFLIEADTAPGSLVLILAADRITVITAIIATLKAGCAFVPLDPDTPRQRLATLLADIAPAWVISEVPLLAELGELAPGLPPFTVLCTQPSAAIPSTLRYAAAFHGYHNPTPCAVPMDPDALAYIYFTSGSTGKPKGIAGRLKAIDHFIRWEIQTFALDPGTRVSQLTTPAFDAFLRDMFTPLCAGGTVCIPPSPSIARDARRLIAWLDSQHIELLHCVPSLFRSIVNEALRPDLFPALRWIAMAGEPLLPADVQRWMQVFGERVQLVNFYGPSETTMIKFYHLVRAADQERRSIPIGKPMEGARAMIVDAQGKPCPAGTIGEIYIRTPYCSLGYYQQPELTSAVFFKNPHNDDPHDLIYKTGDFGRILEDGNYELLGRRDQQVKIRGVRVELGEVENALRSHPLVADVVVIDREDQPGNKYLCAYVVASQPIDTHLLHEYLATILPATMLPSLIVLMEALPRTITGKVDRKALPAPSELRSQSTATQAQPRTPIESVLVSLWSAVLGIPQIGIHDNFFEIGGHSLLATQVLARVLDTFQVEIPLQRLLTKPTIAHLAEAIEEATLQQRGLHTLPLQPVPRDQPLPLSFAQQRLWAIEQLRSDNPVTSHMPLLLQINGRIDIATLERSINAIVQRHEVLRTTFVAAGDQPVQSIAPQLTIPLRLVDLRDQDAASRARSVQQLEDEETQRPFDLAHGPLLRALLIQLDEQSYHLLINVHHIVFDRGSVGIFMRELIAFYSAFSSGQLAQLPPLSLQYADFAAWLRQWMQGDLLEAQVAYWRTQLAGVPPLLKLPTDRPRPPVQSFRGAHHRFALDAELSTALKNLSKQEGVTLFITLLAGFTTLLYRYSNQNDIVIAFPMNNRHRTELEGLIGLFSEISVVRTDLAGNPRFHDLLGQVRKHTLEAYDHRNVPFEKLVELAGHPRNLSYQPLFQVMMSIEEGPEEVASSSDLLFAPIYVETNVAKYDLFLTFAVGSDQVHGIVEYSSDLFDATTISRMIDHFQTLLRSVVANPQSPIEHLALMSESERAQLIANTSAKPLSAAQLRSRLSKLLDEQKGSS